MKTEDIYALFLKAGKVTIDSRKIEENDFFFAFSGANFNAAEFAEAAIQQGALAVIVEDEAFSNPDHHIYYVPSTLECLQNLAVFHRNHLDIPVIGLTGSNGKTTTKELIHSALSKKFNVQCTKGNLNNHIGVPLTVLSITKEHEMVVVEMGANHQKEIELLCSIAKPNIGYVTNFGKAHLEGFGGFEGVIKGKSELYDYLREHHQAVLVNENDSIQIEKTSGIQEKITFGAKDSMFYFESIAENQHIGLSYNEQSLMSHLTGNYNFTNLSAAVALGLHFGIGFNDIKSAVESYRPTNMRSQIEIINGKRVVLDTYNANPSSMSESLKNFSTFSGTKTIIIGDMLELGEVSTEEHRSVLKLAEELKFDEVLTVGKHFSEVNSGKAFSSVEALSEYLKQHPIITENVLLKASRGIALEKIIDFL